MSVPIGILSFLVLLISAFYLLPPPPSALPDKPTRGTDFKEPGPVIVAMWHNLNLSGLTLIPQIKLPPIKIRLSLPFTSSKLSIIVSPTASEIVFKALRVPAFAVRGADAARDPIALEASGIVTDFQGNFGIRVETKFGEKSLWKWKGNGRVEKAKVTDTRFSLAVKLVQTEGGDGVKPRIQVLSTSIDQGEIHYAKITGFAAFGSLATRGLPYFRHTMLVTYPTKLITDYLVREIVEGKVVDSLLDEGTELATGHWDLETYGAMLDEDRPAELGTPLDYLFDNPTQPSSPSSSSSEDPPIMPPTPAPADGSAPSLPPPPPASKVDNTASLPFQLHCHLAGPTRFTHFPLPSFSPPLYRPGGGGARNALQALNPFTSEFKLVLDRLAIDHISFSKGSIAFDPFSAMKGDGGEVIVTVEELEVRLQGHFKLSADTNQLIAFTTGLKKIGEKGEMTTLVKARSLQLRFRLKKREEGEKEKGTTAYVLKESTISPFTSIEPRFTLGNKLLGLGAEVVNVITSTLREQIAQGASLVIAQFMKDAVRERLQGLMEGVEDRLADVGIEPATGTERGAVKRHHSLPLR